MMITYSLHNYAFSKDIHCVQVVFYTVWVVGVIGTLSTSVNYGSARGDHACRCVKLSIRRIKW